MKELVSSLVWTVLGFGTIVLGMILLVSIIGTVRDRRRNCEPGTTIRSVKGFLERLTGASFGAAAWCALALWLVWSALTSTPPAITTLVDDPSKAKLLAPWVIAMIVGIGVYAKFGSTAPSGGSGGHRH